ncbi:amino acid dehydrogenase family protein, partial [Trifolium pratense]
DKCPLGKQIRIEGLEFEVSATPAPRGLVAFFPVHFTGKNRSSNLFPLEFTRHTYTRSYNVIPWIMSPLSHEALELTKLFCLKVLRNILFYLGNVMMITAFNEQTPTVIDGKLMATEIRSKIADQVRQMKKCLGKVPGLAVILVGQRRDSLTYVHNKIIACEEVGMKSVVTELPTDCADADVQNAVMRFNKDPSIHGILVQLPLPQHLDEEKILDALCLEKDVDGFHPLNMGNLSLRGREPLFIPCTPKACIELLIRSGVKIMGKKAVVIGRSNIVGLPTSLLLQRHHATVTIVHAFTENPEQITSEADIVVSAAGVPSLVRGNWIKSGATVIDVG